jgi:hypothetical protein
MSADPDPGWPKLSHQKGEKEEGLYLKSMNVLCRGLRRHIRYDGFLSKIFLKFVIKNLVWIRIRIRNQH